MKLMIALYYMKQLLPSSWVTFNICNPTYWTSSSTVWPKFLMTRWSIFDRASQILPTETFVSPNRQNIVNMFSTGFVGNSRELNDAGMADRFAYLSRIFHWIWQRRPSRCIYGGRNRVLHLFRWSLWCQIFNSVSFNMNESKIFNSVWFNGITFTSVIRFLPDAIGVRTEEQMEVDGTITGSFEKPQ